MQAKLTIALQKSGRLSNGCIDLFQSAGIKIYKSKNQLLFQDEDFGVDFIFARDDDIPALVENGIVDLGVIGENLLQEYDTDLVEIITRLGFAKCRLSIAKPSTKESFLLQNLNGKSIATSYPKTLNNFLKKNNIKAKVVVMHGSVELAPKIGIADLICDLVSSGATLKENGLSEVKLVSNSEAVLIGNIYGLTQPKNILLKRLLLRINGVIDATTRRYIMMHLDREKVSGLGSILSGSESPTILELQGMPNKVAVHLVSLEGLFWDTIEKLKELGASSILVMPIEKMIL